MKKIFNILFVIIENIALLYGVLYLNWDILFILFVFGVEWFLISLFTFIKIKINGGNELLFKYLHIDKDHYSKVGITNSKNSSPFFLYSMMLVLWNFHLLYSIYALFTIFKPDSVYIIFVIFLNQLVFFVSAKIDNENDLINLASTPMRNIVFIGLGALAGGVFTTLLGHTIFILIGLLVFKFMIDVLSFTSGFKNFNRSILEFSGVKLLKS